MPKQNSVCDIREWAFYQEVTAIGLAVACLKCDPAPRIRHKEGYTGKEKLPTDPISLKIAALAQKINNVLLASKSDSAPESDSAPKPELKVLLTAAETLSAKTPIKLLQEAQKHIEKILEAAQKAS